MFKSLLETIQEGFKSVSKKTEETELAVAALAAEVEYQSCLMELQGLNNEI